MTTAKQATAAKTVAPSVIAAAIAETNKPAIVENKALTASVAASRKMLDKASEAGITFAATVRTGVESHGLVTFANALLDSIRTFELLGEKGLRAIGTGPGSTFAKYTLAVRTLKECAPEGEQLKVSAKSGESTECATMAAPVQTAKDKAKASTTGATTPDASGADIGAGADGGEARIASMGESLANLVAMAGDNAFLEAFTLLAANNPSSLSRLIGAGIAFASNHAGVNDGAAKAVSEFKDLLAMAG